MKIINNFDEINKNGTSMLIIGTDWCKFCASTYEAIAEVMPEYAGIEIFKIDGDENPDAIMDVGAKTYPQILLYKDGEKIAQRESAKSDDLRAWISENID
jgi:thioredoxin 1